MIFVTHLRTQERFALPCKALPVPTLGETTFQVTPENGDQ